MRIAAIDLGSNTVKLSVADVDHSPTPRKAARSTLGAPHEAGRKGMRLSIRSRSSRGTRSVTRIGERLDVTGHLQPEAIEAYAFGAPAVCGACASARRRQVGLRGHRPDLEGRQRPSFLERVETETGIPYRIIDGLREGRALFSRGRDRVQARWILVLDVGGRSTELIPRIRRWH